MRIRRSGRTVAVGPWGRAVPGSSRDEPGAALQRDSAVDDFAAAELVGAVGPDRVPPGAARMAPSSSRMTASHASRCFRFLASLRSRSSADFPASSRFSCNARPDTAACAAAGTSESAHRSAAVAVCVTPRRSHTRSTRQFFRAAHRHRRRSPAAAKRHRESRSASRRRRCLPRSRASAHQTASAATTNSTALIAKPPRRDAGRVVRARAGAPA